MEFDEVNLWIQLHNLPIVCMHPKAVTEIGMQVGKVIEVDVGEGGRCLGKYARVWVCTSICKPLLRCANISLGEDAAERLIIFLYEKLPDFCHACGRIGHLMRECSDQDVDKNKPLFGNWMRAKKESEGRRTKANHPDPPQEQDFRQESSWNKQTQEKDPQQTNKAKGNDQSQNKQNNVRETANRNRDWKKRARDISTLKPNDEFTRKRTGEQRMENVEPGKRLKVARHGENSLRVNCPIPPLAEAAMQPRLTL